MDRYYHRKIVVTASVMSVFAVIQLTLGIGLGYYWNGLQGQLSGVIDMQPTGKTGNLWGDILVYLLVFLPIALFAFFSPGAGKNKSLRFVLVIPLLVYLVSAIIELRKILPLGESFKDIYAALDHIIYPPFIICFFMLSLYYLLVIAVPSLLGTRAVGVLTMIIAITFYIMNGIYVVYLHGMGVLDGSFGTMSFVLYLGCFALDVVSFFLALSVLMSYCAMQRDPLIDRKDAKRQAALEKKEAE